MKAVTSYIPQRPPMVMIGELLNATDDSAISSLKIMPDNIFVEDGRLTESGLIENIAQTAAAMVGYQCEQKKIPVPIGFIAAVKNLKINFVPDVGSTIVTKVRITNTVLDVTIVEGKIEQSEKLMCACEMKILIKR